MELNENTLPYLFGAGGGEVLIYTYSGGMNWRQIIAGITPFVLHVIDLWSIHVGKKLANDFTQLVIYI